MVLLSHAKVHGFEKTCAAVCTCLFKSVLDLRAFEGLFLKLFFFFFFLN